MSHLPSPVLSNAPLKSRSPGSISRMAPLCAAALVVMALTTGCASITGDTTHPLRVDTLANGKAVRGADCKVTNDYGQVSVKSGDTMQVRSSGKDLDIACVSAENGDARGRAISRANAGMAGNIIFGGGIGAIIDHNKGTAYTYPSWVQLVFGQELMFDRNDEKDGAPVPGRAAATAGAK